LLTCNIVTIGSIIRCCS